MIVGGSGIVGNHFDEESLLIINCGFEIFVRWIVEMSTAFV